MTLGMNRRWGSRPWVTGATLFIGFVAAGYLLLMLWNPLRLPDPALQRHLLGETPAGSSVQEVVAFVEASGCEVYGGVADSTPCADAADSDLGLRSMQVNLGDYRGIPWVVNVTAFWNFDCGGRLTDIRIWRTADGL